MEELTTGPFRFIDPIDFFVPDAPEPEIANVLPEEMQPAAVPSTSAAVANAPADPVQPEVPADDGLAPPNDAPDQNDQNAPRNFKITDPRYDSVVEPETLRPVDISDSISAQSMLEYVPSLGLLLGFLDRLAEPFSSAAELYATLLSVNPLIGARNSFVYSYPGRFRGVPVAKYKNASEGNPREFIQRIALISLPYLCRLDGKYKDYGAITRIYDKKFDWKRDCPADPLMTKTWSLRSHALLLEPLLTDPKRKYVEELAPLLENDPALTSPEAQITRRIRGFMASRSMQPYFLGGKYDKILSNGKGTSTTLDVIGTMAHKVIVRRAGAVAECIPGLGEGESVDNLIRYLKKGAQLENIICTEAGISRALQLAKLFRSDLDKKSGYAKNFLKQYNAAKSFKSPSDQAFFLKTWLVPVADEAVIGLDSHEQFKPSAEYTQRVYDVVGNVRNNNDIVPPPSPPRQPSPPPSPPRQPSPPRHPSPPPSPPRQPSPPRHPSPPPSPPRQPSPPPSPPRQPSPPLIRRDSEDEMVEEFPPRSPGPVVDDDPPEFENNGGLLLDMDFPAANSDEDDRGGPLPRLDEIMCQVISPVAPPRPTSKLIPKKTGAALRLERQRADEANAVAEELRQLNARIASQLDSDLDEDQAPPPPPPSPPHIEDDDTSETPPRVRYTKKKPASKKRKREPVVPVSRPVPRGGLEEKHLSDLEDDGGGGGEGEDVNDSRIGTRKVIKKAFRPQFTREIKFTDEETLPIPFSMPKRYSKERLESAQARLEHLESDVHTRQRKTIKTSKFSVVQSPVVFERNNLQDYMANEMYNELTLLGGAFLSRFAVFTADAVVAVEVDSVARIFSKWIMTCPPALGHLNKCYKARVDAAAAEKKKKPRPRKYCEVMCNKPIRIALEHFFGCPLYNNHNTSCTYAFGVALPMDAYRSLVKDSGFQDRLPYWTQKLLTNGVHFPARKLVNFTLTSEHLYAKENEAKMEEMEEGHASMFDTPFKIPPLSEEELPESDLEEDDQDEQEDGDGEDDDDMSPAEFAAFMAAPYKRHKTRL